MVLAIPSVVLGLWGSPLMDYPLLKYFNHHFHAHGTGLDFFLHELTLPMGYLPFLAFLFGTLGAYYIYVNGAKLEDKPVNVFFKEKFNSLYECSSNKWYIDEIYEFLISLCMSFFRVSWKFFERVIIEGLLINGLAWRGSEFVGEVLKLSQSGRVQNYILIMFLGFIVSVFIFMI